MNNGIEQSIEEIVTEIAMSSDNKPWLILEGASSVMHHSYFYHDFIVFGV